MSSLITRGNAAGTGSVTLESPNTNSDYTLSLPAQTATIATLTTPSFGTTIGVGGATAAASGAGITFPATVSASSDANTLDDYEEGSWTPEIRLGGAAAGVTYSGNRNGRYTKIGRIVTVSFFMELTNKGSSTGSLTVVTLPFVPYNAVGYPYYVGTVANESDMASMPTGVFCLAWSDSNLYIRSNSATAWTAVTNSNLTNSSKFYCTITYEAV